MVSVYRGITFQMFDLFIIAEFACINTSHTYIYEYTYLINKCSNFSLSFESGE